MSGDDAQVGLFVVSILTFLVFFVGLVLAFIQLRAHVKTEARKATLQLISSREIHDPGMDDAKRGFKRLMDMGDGVAAHLEENANDILPAVKLLNHYELVATGVREGIIDERIYSKWSRGPMIRVWKDSEHIVRWLRAKRVLRGEDPDTLYEQFEAVVKVWQQEQANADEEAA